MTTALTVAVFWLTAALGIGSLFGCIARDDTPDPAAVAADDAYLDDLAPTDDRLTQLLTALRDECIEGTTRE